MTATVGNNVIRDTIINDFTNIVRNQVIFFTSAVSTDTAWNTPPGPAVTVGAVVSSGSGGAVSVYSSKDPGGPSVASLPGAGTITAAGVVSLLRSWMIVYANSHRVRLRNTGTLPVPDIVHVLRLTTDNGAASQVGGDFDSVVTAQGIGTSQPIRASSINNLINSCQGIWNSRCRDTERATYDYNYCHANHVSHSNHGSRGRR